MSIRPGRRQFSDKYHQVVNQFTARFVRRFTVFDDLSSRPVDIRER